MDHNKLLALWNTDDFPELRGVDPAPDDAEPFMLRQHTDEEVTDYDDGFKAGFRRRPNDDTKSQAWQRGWAAAQE